MKTVANPPTKAEKFFAKVQEACRKDVERAFGVLQIKWRILKNCHWMDAEEGNDPTGEKVSVRKLVLVCIILHNMVVQKERGYMEKFDQFDAVARRAAAESEETLNDVGYLFCFRTHF